MTRKTNPVRKGRALNPPPCLAPSVPTEGGTGRNKELMLSISTIPSIPVCRQQGMLSFSNGVKVLQSGKGKPACLGQECPSSFGYVRAHKISKGYRCRSSYRGLLLDTGYSSFPWSGLLDFLCELPASIRASSPLNDISSDLRPYGLCSLSLLHNKPSPIFTGGYRSVTHYIGYPVVLKYLIHPLASPKIPANQASPLCFPDQRYTSVQGEPLPEVGRLNFCL